MLSPQLRNQVNQLWDMFWSSGMTNPLTAIEQITYLIFLKRLEALDDERVRQGKPSYYGLRLNCNLPHSPDEQGTGQCKGHETCKWSYLSKLPSHEHLSQYVFPWLRQLDTTIEMMGNGGVESQRAIAGRLEDAYFQLPPEKVNTLTTAIGMVDRLFASVGKHSANDDLMGDIFEHLLSEISTSGKNGQFRTPRHIIRFMVELLDPKPGQRIVDPAAGTGGFLFNAIQHLLVQASDPESVVYEWDGTPHRYTGGIGTEESLAPRNFVGYDNDRTMVRIGWMNLILHGIENPEIVLRDALGPKLTDKAEYSLALANPPFTGNLDEDDLSDRFQQEGKKAKVPTNKLDLLFVWLLLDLLERGGQAAVIVPEGVLFGSTGAHRELRRQLLFEHDLEAVISLPGGVFQPYTGVKTSVLVFQKVGAKHKRDEMPRTKRVWFYEVEADGYSLDAKRNGQPTSNNDLWDALHKFKNRESLGESEEYFQPEVYLTRWRIVNKPVIAVKPNFAHEEGKRLGIAEIWSELSANPEEATKAVTEATIPVLEELLALYYAQVLTSSGRGRKRQMTAKNRIETALKSLKNGLTGVNGIAKNYLENREGGEEHALKALRTSIEALEKRVLPPEIDEETFMLPPFLSNTTTETGQSDSESVATLLKETQQGLAQAFMKLDGYNTYLLRSPEVRPIPGKEKIRSWWVDVRVWTRRDDWTDRDETVTGSHDANGNLRPEFLADDRIYHTDGTVKAEYIEPGCIEADDLNLSASRYRPLNVDTEEYEAPAKIIRGLQQMEGQLQDKLKYLLELVEGIA